MAETKNWVVVIKHTKEILPTGVWGSYSTKEEAQIKREEIIGTEKDIVATVLPLTPPNTQIIGKKRMATQQQQQQPTKENKTENFKYFYVMREHYGGPTYITVCLKKEDLSFITNIEWFRLHAKSDCSVHIIQSDEEKEEDDEEEKEENDDEEDHDFAECVWNAGIGNVSVRKITSNLDLSGKNEDDEIYAVAEKEIGRGAVETKILVSLTHLLTRSFIHRNFVWT